MKHLTLLFVAILLAFVTILPAHPASEVSANFNKDENLLVIDFRHNVKNVGDHFISDVVISRNKKEIAWQKLTYQDNNLGGSVVYKINDIKAKDKLEITVTCNKIGKKSFTLDIK